MPFETAVFPPRRPGYETPLLALAVARGALPASLAALDQATGGALGRLFAAGDFSGKRDETPLDLPAGPRATRAAGRPRQARRDRSRTSIRRAASVAAKRARALGVPRAAFHLAAGGAGRCRAGRRGPGDRRGTGPGRLAVQRDEAAARGEEARARADRRPGARRPPTRSRRATGSAPPSARDRPWRAASRCCRATCARRRYVAQTAAEIAARHGFGDHRARQGGDRDGEDGRAAGGGAGQRRGAALHRARVQGRARARRSSWSGRASRSTPAASRSSRRRTWRT